MVMPSEPHRGSARRTARPPAWQILIAGSGIPGQVLALALARALPGQVEVTLCDPQGERPRVDPRAYALSAASRNILVSLGLWDRLAGNVQPIRAMTLTDSRLDDAIRPTYLRFQAETEPLGGMIEAADLMAALVEGRRACGLAVLPLGVTAFAPGHAETEITLSDGTVRRARLLVAADGARSRLRDLADIAWFGRRYPQSGIVATVEHERDHGGTAVQHFLPSGPFAMLPLQRRGERAFRSSIVWTELTARVPTLLALPADAATAEVERRFGRDLGAITLRTPLVAHPLSVGLARRYVGPRFALLGDAAHEIHPLAGQGLNLALADAAALASRIADAIRLGLDPGGSDGLGAYERDRRFDAVALAATTDSLNKLFGNDRLPIRILRDIGLGIVDRTPSFKTFFAEEAAGTLARAPRLMRGQPL